nr:lytic transglycosylase domain-containing protein [uncultured Caldimonas sp.]
MTAFDSLRDSIKGARNATVDSVTVFAKDVGHGLLEISHNSLAFVGLVVLAAAVFTLGRPELRHALEVQALGWLQARQEARLDASPEAFLDSLVEPEAITRATAADPAELSKQQAAVTLWISRRYRVAPQPVARLVKEAWHVGERAGLEPTLILAIMAIESGFNPFAQSSVGAQGLMQVMTRVHDDKYQPFGGTHAAFDPVTNLRVGVKVLKECIARAGSLEGGLRFYVGAANLPDDGGYAAKVLSEQSHLRNVAAGRHVPINAPQLIQTVQTAPPASEGAASGAEPAAIPPVDPLGKTTEQVAWVR